jgi:hypothetical protein
VHGSELYGKYRQRIEELADERRSTELSLTILRTLLKEFESEAAALTPAVGYFVCDEIANQLEHEALHSASKHRRDILLAAVKGFDGMSFPTTKP